MVDVSVLIKCAKRISRLFSIPPLLSIITQYTGPQRLRIGIIDEAKCAHHLSLLLNDDQGTTHDSVHEELDEIIIRSRPTDFLHKRVVVGNKWYFITEKELAKFYHFNLSAITVAKPQKEVPSVVENQEYAIVHFDVVDRSIYYMVVVENRYIVMLYERFEVIAVYDTVTQKCVQQNYTWLFRGHVVRGCIGYRSKLYVWAEDPAWIFKTSRKTYYHLYVFDMAHFMSDAVSDRETGSVKLGARLLCSVVKEGGITKRRAELDHLMVIDNVGIIMFLSKGKKQKKTNKEEKAVIAYDPVKKSYRTLQWDLDVESMVYSPKFRWLIDFAYPTFRIGRVSQCRVMDLAAKLSNVAGERGIQRLPYHVSSREFLRIWNKLGLYDAVCDISLFVLNIKIDLFGVLSFFTLEQLTQPETAIKELGLQSHYLHKPLEKGKEEEGKQNQKFRITHYNNSKYILTIYGPSGIRNESIDFGREGLWTRKEIAPDVDNMFGAVKCSKFIVKDRTKILHFNGSHQLDFNLEQKNFVPGTKRLILPFKLHSNKSLTDSRTGDLYVVNRSQGAYLDKIFRYKCVTKQKNDDGNDWDNHQTLTVFPKMVEKMVAIPQWSGVLISLKTEMDGAHQHLFCCYDRKRVVCELSSLKTHFIYDGIVIDNVLVVVMKFQGEKRIQILDLSKWDKVEDFARTSIELKWKRTCN